jgi:hypothetical protein
LESEDSYLFSPQYLKTYYLIFGEVNLKAKAIEVNRYLEDRSNTGPKIIKYKKYELEIMIVEVSGPPRKANRTRFLEGRRPKI